MNRAGGFFLLAFGAMAAALPIAPDVRAQAAPRGEIVVAQAERPRRGGIFRFLFRNRRQEVRPAPMLIPREQARPRKQRQSRQREAARPREQARPRKQRRNRAAAPAPRELAAVEKAADAERVLVVGDFMAGALAKGLTETYAQNGNVAVVDAHNGSSGLVRSDVYDWPSEIAGLAAAEKADAILVLVGANDRQDIGGEAGAIDFGSEPWKAAYTARVAALADRLKETGKPVLWAGLAPVRQGAMSRDYSAFNGIVREQLESRGLRYVDIWNGFADEDGKFASSGPDVSGQPAQLRAGDGLNFTRAGQRKLAYFVERELNEALGGATPVLAAVDAAAATGEPGESVPRIGPMVPIEALTVGSGDALSTSPAMGNAEPPADAIAGAIAGGAAAGPPAGRADSFVWPTAAAAVPPTDAATPKPTAGILSGG